MNTVITQTGGYDYGPSTFLAKVGSPSPTNPNLVQYSQSSGLGWLEALKNATKAAVKAAIGPGAATTQAIQKSAQGLAEGAKAAGVGIGKAATSAAGGVKIGAAILVVLIGIVLIAQVRGALKA